MSSDDANTQNPPLKPWFMIAVLFVVLVLLFVFASTQNFAKSIGPTPIPVPAGWQLVWHDEFDGTEIDLKNWTYDIGGNGWGNQELEYYSNRPENARVENCNLVIEARKELLGGRPYSSARLKTQGLQEWAYGRIEARMKLPSGQGIWPAFWMLGNNINKASWPAAGEIDIMENIGKEPGIVHATVHGPGYSGGDGVTAQYAPEGIILSDDFHVYAIEWEPDQIRWYFDDTLYQTITPTDLPAKWVYDHPFFVILNLAVGGRWPGYPDDTTVFPQQLLVDYVRVFQRQ